MLTVRSLCISVCLSWASSVPTACAPLRCWCSLPDCSIFSGLLLSPYRLWRVRRCLDDNLESAILPTDCSMKTPGDRISIMAAPFLCSRQTSFTSPRQQNHLLAIWEWEQTIMGNKRTGFPEVWQLPSLKGGEGRSSYYVKCFASAGIIPHLSPWTAGLLLLCQCLFQPVSPHFI